ncbi:MAG: phosphomethylpyrimidine kinase [Acidithiobacillales bacterium SM1_46]|jgi:hydroxymethylpyrimidine/phosphomethylpyrimidine kinase|nr:MAG: phosphomethylpyrimidine kinase [Acidithiobacillales bacterium SM1_46]
MSDKLPIVLVFAGADPTGGAGLAADVLTLASMGCHAAVVVTAVTAQDTAGIKAFTPIDTGLVIQQARAVLEDMPVAAFKTGMLGNVANVTAVASIIADYPDVPLVVDPVQVSGRGDALAEEPLDDALRTVLFPRTTLVTPNSVEARALAPEADSLDACAQELMNLGCQYVLITGTHEPTPNVMHRLYGNRRRLEDYTFERLQAQFHGSGCTLASACAATLAHGLEMPSAVDEALQYAWESLKYAQQLGMGQAIPDRLYWARQGDTHTDDE